MNTAIELHDVSHRFGKILALDNVSLSIPKGATVGLIGPDGVGKSTLLSLIAGVRIIQAGSVHVLGGDMANARERQELSHRIAFMPQGLGKNLYPTLSIDENIEFHARLFGLNQQQRQARIDRLLRATGLLPFRNRAAGKLSGGMKQKLSLCCALVHSPDLLILDEPTTGVDPLSRRQFWALVDELRQEIEGMTVLVATAYIDEAQHFEHLLAMDAGHILVNAPTDEVLQRYVTDSLEEAYIQLLPEEKRQGAGQWQAAPFVPDPDAPPVIEAHDLTKTFGDFTAVDHVSFTIAKGEIFGFLGSNGCGKSTTMKMLTGLLEPTSGNAQLLGKAIDSGSLNTKKRVGYMSQSFSLYEELSVRQNLNLHATLYDIPHKRKTVLQALKDFDLTHVARAKPSALPLGIRQRLQLAAACLHQPEVLILDEPTSGVDPAARDMFWQKLLHLSREKKMTIFVSTHFMNEVLRCDRLSLMDKGKVLAMGTPDEVLAQSGQANMEEAFIHYLLKSEEQNSAFRQPEQTAEHIKHAHQLSGSQNHHSSHTTSSLSWFTALLAWLSVVLTFARREGKELLRDKIRLFFAALGPAVLLAAIGWAISFDVSHLNFAVLDRDNSLESRQLIEHFSGSPYFAQLPEIHTEHDARMLLQSDQAAFILDIPPNFGRDLLQQRQPEISFLIDGTAPFNASSLNAYILGIINDYHREYLSLQGISLQPSAQIVPRFMYNQDFKSVNAMVPSVLILVLMMIPTIMSALAVVRERELGSIQNLYASPASVPQYLLGKQLPYIVMGAINFLILCAMIVFWFGVPLKGSFFALFFGCILMVAAASAFGLLVSSFVRSQTAAFFISAISSMVITMNFSGFMYPVSTLQGSAYVLGHSFPAAWFGIISRGGFNKGLGWLDFLPQYAILLGFTLIYYLLASLFLSKQEK